ncbi:DUF2892 domain-containing protein [Stappia sp. F7233]|uniref:DUF2892 domain-containing protein n=1 Tax=Stappia albiluteola TaxID=2758565 RepID=A0A839AGT1_9HYPH|nr:DUF2892 domain-containing protein [Stappia albiluteola]MBA5779070.1 DUF2892 domain-containing protein [Stappia albiluteola]
MSANVGSSDRLARAVIGFTLLTFAAFGPPDVPWTGIGWLGLFPAVSAGVGWCPLYALLGIETCRTG